MFLSSSKQCYLLIGRAPPPTSAPLSLQLYPTLSKWHVVFIPVCFLPFFPPFRSWEYFRRPILSKVSHRHYLIKAGGGGGGRKLASKSNFQARRESARVTCRYSYIAVLGPEQSYTSFISCCICCRG